MPSACLQWRFHSGERVVARGLLVFLSLLLVFFILEKKRIVISCETSGRQRINVKCQTFSLKNERKK